MAPWAPAFAIAVAVTLTVTPLLRRLALSIGFVDERCVGQSHRSPVPYLGGVGLILAVLVALLVQGRLSPRVGVIAFGAAALGIMGLIDDDRHVHPRYRLFVEIAVAATTVAVGLRIHATEAVVFDVALTILWVVGVTNAINLLDNMDGLAAGVVASASIAVFLLAVLGEQVVVAAVAAAVAGACLAFLPHNRRPARIFMGDAGSLFLGFVLAILTIDVSPALDPPVSFFIPLILLALPVLDTTMVTIARLRRHRSVVEGGKDHLSHRLVTRGMSRRKAVRLLVTFQTALGALAVMAGNKTFPLWWSAAGAVVLVGGLAAVTAPVKVYSEPVLGIPRRVKLVVLAAFLALPVLAAPATLAMYTAMKPAKAGAVSAKLAFEALSSGDTQKTLALFAQAERSFAKAHSSLRSPLVTLGLAVPGLASNVEASRAVVSIGRELSKAGTSLSTLANPSVVRISDGVVPLNELRNMAPALDQASKLVDGSLEKVADLGRFFLVPQLRREVDDLQRRLEREKRPAHLAAEAASLLPGILGGDSERRYFLAFQNNAEVRGTGGLIGNWGELRATQGRMVLERFGRLEELNETGKEGRVLHMPPEFWERWGKFNPTHFWQQANVSPDFPTTARVISDLYPQSGGSRVDGVIAIDPAGLAALLELTGPVMVPGWSESITSDNVVGVTVKDAYIRYPIQDERVAFLGEVSRRVTEAFTSADLGAPAKIIDALAAAAKGGHVQLYFHDQEEESLATTLEVDGAILQPRGDSLVVVNQNMAGNKVDIYLRRKIEYHVRLNPDSDPALLTGTVKVTLQNDAPASGLPKTVIGPYDERFRAGENRTYVSVYTALPGSSATVEGRPADVESHRELGHEVRSAELSIQSRETRTLEVGLRGQVSLAPGGWYRLDIGHQTSLQPDELHLSLTVPQGWRIAEGDGISLGPDRRSATADLRLERQATLWIKLERTGWDGVLDRLFSSG